MNNRERFESFESQNYFTRVDNEHPLELHIGLDEKGRKAIELRAVFNPRKVSGTSAIEVNQYKRTDYNTIRFSLCDPEISGLFYKFCDDLIEQSRGINEKTEGYQTILTRFYQWKKLFVASKNNMLAESQIMGMIGEILYMRGPLAERLGLSDSLKSWSGQELTHKDFSFGDSWAEVKSTTRNSQSVKISSLEQLDSENPGRLVVYMLEKMSPAYNGITLNKLILETRNMFSDTDERDSFQAKVALQGYEYNDYYDDFVYEISSIKEYLVSEEFPRLTHSNVPAAVTKAAYDLSLADLADYII